jgi:nickel/cobalt transporter (NicO) family protein
MRRRRARRLLIAAAAVVPMLLAAPGTAHAHPLGNFTINLYSGLRVQPDRVLVDYVVDMAEIPGFQARQQVDANGDGRVTPDEAAPYRRAECSRLAGGTELVVDGASVALHPVSSGLRFAVGVGGLPTLRLNCVFEGGISGAVASGSGERTITYTDRNYAERVGWHEVAAVGDGTTLAASEVPAQSVSERLTRYPKALQSAPLDVREATLRATLGGPAADFPSGGPDAGARDTASERLGAGSNSGFASLITKGELSAWAIVVSLLLSIVFGAVHALSPGHGKTLMAAYLVGAGGRAREAVVVGGAVAVMHTASVLGLGVLILSLERTFSPDRIYPWLGLASGLVAIALGAVLVVQRLGTWRDARLVDAREHDHDEGVDDHGHAHGPGGHAHVAASAPVLSRRGLTALAVAGGLLPSPTAVLVLLSAVSFGRVAFGLSLIAGFSLGLASALIVVGLVTLRARDVVSNRLSSNLGRLLPVLSATVVGMVGVVLTVRGVVQL